MSKLAKYLISDLQADWSKPSIKFFRSNDSYGYIVWLTIMNSYFEKEPISIEILVTRTEKYASRKTILDFLNKGVESKFLNRIYSIKDKRKVFIEPAEITIQEYNQWSKDFIKKII